VSRQTGKLGPWEPIFRSKLKYGEQAVPGVLVGEDPPVHGTAFPGAINVTVSLPTPALTRGPLDILGSKLIHWYDADDTSANSMSGTNAPPTDGGTAPENWLDKVANFDMTLGGAQLGVTWHDNVSGGAATMRFDGTQGYYVNIGGAFLNSTAIWEAWVVCKSDESGTGTVFAEGLSSSGAQVIRLYDDDTANDYVLQYTNISNVDRYLNTQDRSTAAFDLVIARDSGAATGTSLEVVDVDAGTTGAYTDDGGSWDRFGVGASVRSSATLFFDVDIAEIMFLNAAASSGERTALAGYFNSKFGQSWSPN
jgi:hypothetical protein